MSKIYAIKLNNGHLHQNNLGEIVYFSNKQNARDYMKYNHYEGDVQQFNIDTDKDKKIVDLETKLEESESELEKQKEKYDKLYGCYKKTSSEDLQDKYRLAEENEILKKALKLAREYMFNVMCADDVPFESWFIECAKNDTEVC